MTPCDICGIDTYESSLVLRSIELPVNQDVVMLYNPDRLICTNCDSMTDQELEDTILREDK